MRLHLYIASYCCDQSFGGSVTSTNYKIIIPFAASVQVRNNSLHAVVKAFHFK